MKACDRCRHLDFKLNHDRTEANPEAIVYVCSKEIHDLTLVQDIESYKVDCALFSSLYIEYPIEVSSIEHPKEGGVVKSYSTPTGSWVAVRPCNKKYDGKTFLGLFLGEVDVGLYVRHCSETKKLTITRKYNPAIFVPELNEIIYGCGSFWRKLKSADDLNQLTYQDIQNTWYVKALRSLSGSIDNDILGGAEYVI